MTEELQKKAEDFIIERYKIVKCYREDNAETREYMRMDVHSQYEEEYQLYLAATKELQEENAELEKACEETQELLDKQIEVTYKLDKENADLKDCFKIAKDNEYEYQSLFTKAKEILKAVVDFYPTTTATILCEAEKFISEVEK